MEPIKYHDPQSYLTIANWINSKLHELACVYNAAGFRGVSIELTHAMTAVCGMMVLAKHFTTNEQYSLAYSNLIKVYNDILRKKEEAKVESVEELYKVMYKE